ncbi:hypothetical protein [Paracoccus sp. IB05]|uniref:hypothetical protein n=1 Tax=Paracoccus sp. IB05 TaxID=2779367 RepID=UPI0018E7FC13|nr:hypothetical protein [Paracoccus sp. IB05]MBJ2151569.1 hypothetical protein [Paracoccus sp. IB05]
MSLQHLIDFAAAEVFADYDDKSISSKIICLHEDGNRERLPLTARADWGDVLDFARSHDLAAEIGAESWVAFHHAVIEGKSIIIASAQEGGQRAMTGFVVTGNTGDFSTDLALIEMIQTKEYDHTLHEPTEWLGGTATFHFASCSVH